MATTSRLTLYQDVATQLEGELLGGTASSGSTTTLVDTTASGTALSPLDPNDEQGRFDGEVFLYLHTGTGAGQERRIKSYAPASGTLTVDSNRAFATAPDNTSQYHILRVLSHARIVDCLNTGLRRLAYRTTSPLTLVTDGDMETSGVSNWTGSSGTPTKESTTVAYVYSGTQSLKLVTSGANGYARTASMAVNETESYWVEVMTRADPANGSNSVLDLLVWDVTNAAAITLSGTTSHDQADGSEWVWLRSDFTVPSGCKQIQVRLRDRTSGLTSYWDDLRLVHQSHQFLALPSWVETGLIEQVFWLAAPTTTNPRKRDRFPVSWWRHHRDRPAASPDWLEISGSGSYAWLIEGLALGATLSTDAGTTALPRDLVVAGALAEAYRRLGSPVRGANRTPYQDQYAYWQDQFFKLAGAQHPRARVLTQMARPY